MPTTSSRRCRIGLGSFTLSGLQTYGSSGWADYPVSSSLVGDVNGDGRSDLVWSSSYQTAGPTNNNLVVAGLANANGTFQLGSTQNFGSTWSGRLSWQTSTTMAKPIWSGIMLPLMTRMWTRMPSPHRTAMALSIAWERAPCIPVTAISAFQSQHRRQTSHRPDARFHPAKFNQQCAICRQWLLCSGYARYRWQQPRDEVRCAH